MYVVWDGQDAHDGQDGHGECTAGLPRYKSSCVALITYYNTSKPWLRPDRIGAFISITAHDPLVHMPVPSHMISGNVSVFAPRSILLSQNQSRGSQVG